MNRLTEAQRDVLDAYRRARRNRRPLEAAGFVFDVLAECIAEDAVAGRKIDRGQADRYRHAKAWRAHVLARQQAQTTHELRLVAS